MKNKYFYLLLSVGLLFPEVVLANGGDGTQLNLAQVAAKMGEQAPALAEALKYLMYMVGMLFVATGITDSMKASKPHNSGHISGGRIFSRILLGGLLIGGGYALDILSLGSLTGQSWNTFGIYEDSRAGSDQFSPFILAVIRIVQVFGAYSVFKGILLWKVAGDGRDAAGGDKVGSGCIHILFGGCLMNFIEFFTAVANFFNFPVPAFFPT